MSTLKPPRTCRLQFWQSRRTSALSLDAGVSVPLFPVPPDLTDNGVVDLGGAEERADTRPDIAALGIWLSPDRKEGSEDAGQITVFRPNYLLDT